MTKLFTYKMPFGALSDYGLVWTSNITEGHSLKRTVKKDLGVPILSKDEDRYKIEKYGYINFRSISKIAEKLATNKKFSSRFWDLIGLLAFLFILFGHIPINYFYGESGSALILSNFIILTFVIYIVFFDIKPHIIQAINFEAVVRDFDVLKSQLWNREIKKKGGDYSIKIKIRKLRSIRDLFWLFTPTDLKIIAIKKHSPNEPLSRIAKTIKRDKSSINNAIERLQKFGIFDKNKNYKDWEFEIINIPEKYDTKYFPEKELTEHLKKLWNILLTYEYNLLKQQLTKSLIPFR